MPQRPTLLDILRRDPQSILCFEVVETDDGKKAIRKLFVKSVAELGYFAQAVFHILMEFSMVHSSQEFTEIIVRKDGWVKDGCS